ncbi:MAG: hypothetical protein K6G26_13030 [Lachnospiraceae bacterium]|nr:hypothetical protein [Lachnospiraceae bacterium]
MEFVEDYLSDKRRKEIEAMKIYNPLAQVTYDNINFAVIKSIDEKYILKPLLGYGNYFREFGVHEVDKSIYRRYAFVYENKIIYFHILNKNIKSREEFIRRILYVRKVYKIEVIEEFNEIEALCKAVFFDERGFRCNNRVDKKVNIQYGKKIIIKEF